MYDYGYNCLNFLGTSLYDESATCTVLLEQKVIVLCSDVLEGILITFISYYIYGYKYPQQIEKTSEFLQR